MSDRPLSAHELSAYHSLNTANDILAACALEPDVAARNVLHLLDPPSHTRRPTPEWVLTSPPNLPSGVHAFPLPPSVDRAHAHAILCNGERGLPLSALAVTRDSAGRLAVARESVRFDGSLAPVSGEPWVSKDETKLSKDENKQPKDENKQSEDEIKLAGIYPWKPSWANLDVPVPWLESGVALHAWRDPTLGGLVKVMLDMFLDWYHVVHDRFYVVDGVEYTLDYRDMYLVALRRRLWRGTSAYEWMPQFEIRREPVAGGSAWARFSS